MRFEIQETAESAADIVIVGIPDGATQCDARFMPLAESLFKSGDLPLKPLETFVVAGSRRTMFIGLPKTADAEAWRRAAGTVVRRAKNAKTIAFAGGDSRAIAEGAVVGGFSVEQYKTADSKAPVETIILAGGQAN